MLFKKYLLCLLSAMCLTFSLLFVPLSMAQEQGEPPPQFLYRADNRLVLVNGYTGETSDLPFDVTELDRFEWSPDGQYLLAQLREPDSNIHSCINLFDVDTGLWLYQEAIACGVERAEFGLDGRQIVYVVTNDDQTEATLWLFDLNDSSYTDLYQKPTETDQIYQSAYNNVGISDLIWSPTGTYLTFVAYRWIMGGTLNTYVVMNMDTQTQAVIHAPAAYYASFYPIWSTDDAWMLMTLKEQNVTSGTLPITNDLGDVYLYHSDTGERHRLTYTPTVREVDIHWTDEGDIAYTEVIEQDYIVSIEEAMTIAEVPRDDIITPEPYTRDNTTVNSSDFMVAPDADIAAWITSSTTQDGAIYELLIGNNPQFSRGETVFSTSISSTYQFDYSIIGWRPSDFVYLQG